MFFLLKTDSSNKFQNNRYNPYSRPGSGGNNYPPQDLQYEHTLSKFSHDSPYCDLNLFLKPDHNIERYFSNYFNRLRLLFSNNYLLLR